MRPGTQDSASLRTLQKFYEPFGEFMRPLLNHPMLTASYHCYSSNSASGLSNI